MVKQARDGAPLTLAMRDALTAALLVLPATTGCGGDIGPGIEKDPDFVKMQCIDGKPQWLADIDPAEAVDYADIRSVYEPGRRLATTGEPCAGATDRDACLAALAGREPVGPGFSLGAGHFVPDPLELVFTRGDQLGHASDWPSVVEFVAPIDTPGEAMLVAASEQDIPCDIGGVVPAAQGYKVQGLISVGCDGKTRRLVHVDAEGNKQLIREDVLREADPNCVVGRRPAGVLPSGYRASEPVVGRYLARAAELEAASVVAFAGLMRELENHGAPEALQRRAARALRDEQRHMASVATLARRYGGKPRLPRVSATPIRSLIAIALENVSEGCVRETLGAVAGAFQARRARALDVRRVYRGIARDEARHARLAWSVARWIDGRLSAEERRQVARAKRASIAELRAEMRRAPAPELIQVLGVPDCAQARAMLDELGARLWAA